MDNNFGKTVSYIRKVKNIPVKSVINNCMTRSSYTRLIEGKNHTSINNFINILDGLHVSFGEFLYISNNFELDDTYKWLDKGYELLLANDIDKLQNMLSILINYIEQDKNETYIHIACVFQLTINFLKRESYDINAKKIIQNYLLNCDMWTHYELVLFNNVMFIFDIELIDVFSKRVLHNLEKYQKLRGYGSESFRLMINILMVYIKEHELNKMMKLSSSIKSFPLKDDMLFEKNLQRLYVGLVNVILGNLKSMEVIKQSMDIFKQLSCNDFLMFFQKYLKNALLKYDVNHDLIDKLF